MYSKLLLTLFVVFSSTQALAEGPLQPQTASPLLFEPNLGQAPSEVRFLARGPQYSILLADQELVLILQPNQTGNSAALPSSAVLRLRWLGSQPGSRFEGEEQQASYSNYFRGSDPARWHTRIPHFGAVNQTGVAPGLDLRFYGSWPQQLEYDLRLGPQFDISRAAFEVEGADDVSVDPSGVLVFQIGGKQIRQQVPQAYEERDGRRTPLVARYELRAKNVVGFSVEGRSPGASLVIDPVILYGTYLGGSTNGDTYLANSPAYSTTIDNLGNLFVSGVTNAIDFPTTSGVFEPAKPGYLSEAVYVSKFDRTGQYLYWSTYLSGDNGVAAGNGYAKRLGVDGWGFVYVTGAAYSGFPVTSNGFQQDCPSSGNPCAFLARLNANGSELQYSTYFGSLQNGDRTMTGGNGVAMGLDHDAYITGWTNAADLPTTSGSYQPACHLAAGSYACPSGFLAHFDPYRSGNASLLYATYLGGPDANGQGASEGDGVTVDSMGNAFVVGLTDFNNFPHIASFGTGNGPKMSRGAADIADSTFILKLSPDGKTTLYSTLLRGASGTSIVVDSNGQAFVTGAAVAGLATTAGAAQGAFAGGFADAFVTKLSTRGTGLQYSTFIGGSGSDVGYDLVINNYGMAFVTGTTESSNFPIGPGAFDRSLGVGTKAFITALQSDGRGLYYSSYLGGSAGATGYPNTRGFGIAMDPGWNAYVVGETFNTDFPVTSNAYQPTLKGSSNAFLSKIVIAGDLRTTMGQNMTSVPRYGVVTYNARVTNYGPDGSDNVVFSAPIPAGMTYAGVYSANATSCTPPPWEGTVGTLVCRKTRLESGQTLYVNVYFRAIAASGSTLTNTVSGTAQTQDPWPSNNTATLSVKVQ